MEPGFFDPVTSTKGVRLARPRHRRMPNLLGGGLVAELAGKDPDAKLVGTLLVKHGTKIDPNLRDPLFLLLKVDDLKIYDARLGRMWKHVAKENIVNMVALIYAGEKKLAGMNQCSLHHAINTLGEGIDMSAVLAAVKQCWPDLNLAYTAKRKP